MGVPAAQPLPAQQVGWEKSTPVAHRTVGRVDVLFSKTARQFNDNLKVNVLYSCDSEGRRNLRRTWSGDSLLLLRGGG